MTLAFSTYQTADKAQASKAQQALLPLVISAEVKQCSEGFYIFAHFHNGVKANATWNEVDQAKRIKKNGKR